MYGSYVSNGDWSALICNRDTGMGIFVDASNAYRDDNMVAP